MSDNVHLQQANTIARLRSDLADARAELAATNREWNVAVLPLMAEMDRLSRELALVTAERNRLLDLLANPTA